MIESEFPTPTACTKPRGISDEDLIAGARIVTAAFVVEQLAAGAATLDW